MLVVLVLVPSVALAIAVVAVLDRLGVLPRADGGVAAGYGSWAERVPRSALFVAGAVMAGWILAWLVLLVVGLQVLSS